MQDLFLQQRTDRPGDRPVTRPVAVTGIAAPLAAYNHGIEVTPGARLVFCSGQLGQAPDGTVPRDCEGQTEQCFRNIAAILKGADMQLAHIIRINAFVTAREHMAPYMRVRDRLFAGPSPVSDSTPAPMPLSLMMPASTLMIVGGFTREEFLVEVEVVAAAPA